MAPPLLQLKDIALTFGGTALLTGAELSVSPGERVTLVGRNGSGKSTLLKIAAGLVEPDRGSVFVQPGALVRYLPQEPDFSGFASTLAYVEAGLRATDDVHAALYLLEQLGLTGQEDPARLSGGEARRVALARVLVPAPDILLLDEPTNHLDLTTIEWLERDLDARRSAMVIISHDRRFLSTLSRSTVWLDRGETRRLERGFAHFEEWRDAVLAEEERDQHKLDRKIVAEEHWLRYGVSGRRKRNMRRVGQLQTLREQRRTYRATAGDVAITAGSAAPSGARVIEAIGVSKSYGDRAIVADFSTRIQRGDRLGIVGPNGSGKTTLISLLTGMLAPDTGSVRLGSSLAIATLDQQRDSLDPNISVAQTLTGGRGDTVMVNGQAKHVDQLYEGLFVHQRAGRHAGRQAVRWRTRAADAGAGSGQAVKPVGARRADQRPRHGNARRVGRDSCRLSGHGPSDQPRSRFPGPARRRRHRAGGRREVDRICRRLQRYAGAARRRPDPAEAEAGRAGGAGSREASAFSRCGAPPARRRLTFKDKHALETLPKTIAALQEDMRKLQTKLDDPQFYARDRAGFEKVSAALGELQQQIAALEEQWLELEILREELAGS